MATVRRFCPRWWAVTGHRTARWMSWPSAGRSRPSSWEVQVVATAAQPRRARAVGEGPPGVPDEGWQVHYALFARTRFTDAAAALADDSGALLGVPAYSVRVTLPIWRKTPASTPVCRASARLSSCKGTISAMGAVAGQAEGRSTVGKAGCGVNRARRRRLRSPVVPEPAARSEGAPLQSRRTQSTVSRSSAISSGPWRNWAALIPSTGNLADSLIIRLPVSTAAREGPRPTM